MTDAATARAVPADREARMAAAAQWFEELRTRICAAFEAIEDELAEGPHAGLPPGSPA
jgi:coproporphyrinogen III oxidase